MKTLPVTPPARTLLLIVADGVRHDVLKEELDAGKLPAIAALAARGGLHEISSCFPSVTGAGYIPFYVGRFPAAVGVPGLRWFDRSRRIGFWPAHARSYAGMDLWHLDHDLDRTAHTLFELAKPSIAAMSMLGRGSKTNIGRSVKWLLRVAPAHFRGNLHAWRVHEENITRQFFRRFERLRPRFASIAFTSPDKLAHKMGPRSPAVRAAIRDIDAVVKTAESIASQGGWRDLLDIWIVGDHGHDPVENHEDLHGWLETRGLKVRAHPQVFKRHADVALMVGGNAMAHLYLIPKQRFRSYWSALAPKWQSLHDALLERDAIDLLAVALDLNKVRVSNHHRGSADISQTGYGPSARWSYQPRTGDPLQLGGALHDLDMTAAYDASANTNYPDALVQLTAMVTAKRSGDIIVSAAQNWDLRSRFEPVKHVSTHGALLRDQMMVPLILDRPVSRVPQRTTDVMPSALEALGLPVPDNLDGRSYL